MTLLHIITNNCIVTKKSANISLPFGETPYSVNVWMYMMYGKDKDKDTCIGLQEFGVHMTIQ